MKDLSLIWSNLKRKKSRTVLTVLSIFIAFLLYALLFALSEGFSQGVNLADLDRLVARHRISIIQPLPISYQERIRSVKGISDVTHASWFGGIYQEPKNFFPQIPVEPESYLRMYPEISLPEEQYQAWLETRTGAIIGKKLAARFGWKIGDKIPIRATIWQREDGSDTWEFDVVGIYDGTKKGVDTSGMFFRYDYFDEARGPGKGLVGWYILRVEDSSQSPRVAQEVDELFMNSANETKTEAEGAFAQGFANQIGNIGAIMMAIMGMVFFTILLIAGNTMSQSVRERIGELGVLKALGFAHSRVMRMVLLESCFIAGLGGMAGLGLGWLVASQGDMTGGLLPGFYLPVSKVVMGLVLIGVLGSLAGFFPALYAMRLKVADALRRTG